MAFLDQPSAYENSESLRFVIPSESRDFSQPKETFMGHTVSNSMADLLQADDSSDFVKNVQKFMKGAPLGVSYSGPINGEVNSELKTAIFELESRIEENTGKPVIGTMIFGSTISPTGFNRAVSFLKKETPEKPLAISKETFSEDLVKAFQKFFSQSQPVIGKLYSGPIDGKLNDQLESAAQQTEQIISGKINVSAAGKIWSNGFVTSPDDVKSALDLLGTK